MDFFEHLLPCMGKKIYVVYQPHCRFRPPSASGSQGVVPSAHLRLSYLGSVKKAEKLEAHPDVDVSLIDAKEIVNGRRALYLTCGRGHAASTRLLLDAKANTGLNDLLGWPWTPLALALTKETWGVLC
jgi:hypothetical protein